MPAYDLLAVDLDATLLNSKGEVSPANRDAIFRARTMASAVFSCAINQRQEVPVSSIPRPDLSARPLQVTCQYTVNAGLEEVFAAWTKRFDTWFAQAGTLVLVPEPGRPYFFYNRDDWGRHPHYGRFLDVKENQLIEMTWMTGNGTGEGTQGAETVLRIELVPKGEATEVRLTHSGFASEKSRDGHKQNWPLALKILDEALS